ncbi:MAG TPA: hypothetical protein VGS23_08105 [Thermoplasmata archaeon]|nr:hypothetical protein [Thermoplasmata archaeon]
MGAAEVPGTIAAGNEPPFGGRYGRWALAVALGLFAVGVLLLLLYFVAID